MVQLFHFSADEGKEPRTGSHNKLLKRTQGNASPVQLMVREGVLGFVPFGEEVKGFQGGWVQGEGSDFHIDHRGGGVFQRQQLNLGEKFKICIVH